MIAAVMAVVASVAVDDGGVAIALDDGTVWIVYDREWEELGGCDDGAVVELEPADAGLAIGCGDGSRWTWSAADGWTAEIDDGAEEGPAPSARTWWPALELDLRRWTGDGASGALEGWVRLRWNL